MSPDCFREILDKVACRITDGIARGESNDQIFTAVQGWMGTLDYEWRLKQQKAGKGPEQGENFPP